MKMIPYFSMIKTHSQMIVFVLVTILSGCMGAMAYLVGTGINNKEMNNETMFICMLAAMVWFVLLTWLFIGDSTEWSKPIGYWLNH